MKKIQITLVLLIFNIFIPSVSYGANFLINPLSGEYTKGETFIVALSVNPDSSTVYTAKSELKYPANLLELKSFTFNNSWLALNQPGYDLIDNNSGILIKTGGYSGGVSDPVLFGTASFYVKETGSATIELSEGSLVLDSNNKNILTAFPSAIFTLIEKPAPIPIIQLKVKEQYQNESPTTETIVEETDKNIIEDEEKETAISTSSDLAQEQKINTTENIAVVAEASSSMAWNWLVYILIALSFFALGFYVGRRTS